MAVNFNILARQGPMNLYEGFEQGQQAAAQNALAQQKMAQERDLMSMRRQEFQANLESTQADRRRKAVAEKTAMFRDRVLRAPTPQAARELVRLQHSDPDLGPVIQQFGSLDQDLADIPDDPTGFEKWREREAMGAAEFIKNQASERGFQALVARAKGNQPPAAPAPVGEVVAEPMPAPRGVVREIAPGGAMGAEVPLTRGEPAPVNTLAPVAAPSTNAMIGGGRTPAQIRAEIDTLSMSNDPRAARMVQTLMKEYEASMRVDPSELRTMQALGYPLTTQGYEAFRKAQMKEAQEGAPVAVIGPDGKPTYVTRAQAVGRVPFTPAAVQVLGMGPQREAAGQKAPAGYRFTPSGDLEPIPGGPAARAAEPKPLTPAQEVKRRDTLGKEFKSATAALQTTQDVLDSISFVKSEPGLSRATGYTGMLPSFSEGAAASAETRLANLKGKITALGKAAAASTGAIGSIANQEWKILSDQIAAIDPVKGAGPLLKQLELVETQAQGAMARIRDAYGRQFGEDFERFPQFSDLPAPQSSFKPRAPAGGAAPAAAQGTGGFRYLGKEGK
jgi:hypothetical protein